MARDLSDEDSSGKVAAPRWDFAGTPLILVSSTQIEKKPCDMGPLFSFM